MRRIWEHKSQLIAGFTKKYYVTKLVYYESFDNPTDAIEEKNRLKLVQEKKKIELLNKFNPEWKDLYSFEEVYK